jgi:pyruvate dehydrogenase E1 component beta subunit
LSFPYVPHSPRTQQQQHQANTPQFGKAKIERQGKDLTIVTLSRCVGQSLVAAEELKNKYGIEAEVINLRSIKPLDIEAIVKSVKKTGHMLCVESGFPSFGVASEIMALTCEYAFDYPDRHNRQLRRQADARLSPCSIAPGRRVVAVGL